MSVMEYWIYSQTHTSTERNKKTAFLYRVLHLRIWNISIKMKDNSIILSNYRIENYLSDIVIDLHLFFFFTYEIKYFMLKLKKKGDNKNILKKNNYQ